MRHRGNRALKLHLSRVGAAITDAYTGDASEQAWVSNTGQTTTACSKNMPSAHISPLCSSTALSEGKVSRANSWSQWTDPQGFCYSNLGCDCTPNMEVMGIEWREDPVQLALALAASYSGERYDLYSHQICLSHLKPLGTHTLYKYGSSQGYFFKTTVGTCFT